VHFIFFLVEGEEPDMAAVLYPNGSTMKKCYLLIIAVMCGLLVQCDEPDYHKCADFLPLQDGTEWNYLRAYSSTGDSSFAYADTITYIAKGDTLLNDLRYVKVVDEYDNLIKVMRKEGSKYYGMNHQLYGGFTAEYLFLDDDATVGTSWRHYKQNDIYTEYKVVSTNTTKTYNNVTYQDVMEMEVNYHTSDGTIHVSRRHVYAKGIGEIYAFYPYPSSLTYSDITLSLIDYSR
jgi:hypothetical protein